MHGRDSAQRLVRRCVRAGAAGTGWGWVGGLGMGGGELTTSLAGRREAGRQLQSQPRGSLAL